MKTLTSLLFWLAVSVTFFLYAAYRFPVKDMPLDATVAYDIGLIIIWEWLEKNVGARWRK